MTSAALLLLMAGVERNPGPGASTDSFNARSIVIQQRSAIRLGSLNAGGATSKTAIIDDLIRDNRLDILAVYESWILEDAPSAIKYDIAPDNSIQFCTSIASDRQEKDSQSEAGVWRMETFWYWANIHTYIHTYIHLFYFRQSP